MGIRKTRYGEMKVDTDETVAVTSGTPASINGSDVVKGAYGPADKVILDPDAGANPDMKITVNGGGPIRVRFDGAVSATGAAFIVLYKTGEDGTETELTRSSGVAGGTDVALMETHVGAPGEQVTYEAKVDSGSTETVTIEAGSKFSIESVD